jgi:hypothetical protein
MARMRAQLPARRNLSASAFEYSEAMQCQLPVHAARGPTFHAEQRPIPGSEKNHYRYLGRLPIAPVRAKHRSRSRNLEQQPLVRCTARARLRAARRSGSLLWLTPLRAALLPHLTPLLAALAPYLTTLCAPSTPLLTPLRAPHTPLLTPLRASAILRSQSAPAMGHGQRFGAMLARFSTTSVSRPPGAAIGVALECQKPTVAM